MRARQYHHPISLPFHEERGDVRPEVAGRVVDEIESLDTRLEGGYWLANLLWNIRNRYMSSADEKFSSDEMKLVCEGLLAEIHHLREQLPNPDSLQS